MNEVTIQKEDFSHIIKKQDVWLVFTKNNRCWVCEIDGVFLLSDQSFYILKLASKKGRGV